MNKKKLITAIGPFILALFLLLVVLFVPNKWAGQPKAQELKRGASSMSINVIKGNAIKNTAIGTGDYLPFFGSSELSRINAFHPSVLADHYKRPYEPFLLGAPGTQSLSHYYLLQSMKEELKEKPVVFIISPQWFVKDGVSDPMFSLYYSPLQTYQWLQSLTTIGEAEKFAASRLLSFSSINSDTTISKFLKKIKKGDSLSEHDKAVCQHQFNLLSGEDLLFHKLHLVNKTEKIKRAGKKLPRDYDVDSLDALAVKLGQGKTTNNEFGIANNFYSQRIAPLKGKLANSQTKYNYVKSPEFGDFQLVLNQLAAAQTKVLFVIPPVNKSWSDYTGLSEEMLDTFSRKISYQLQSQGFTNIADYTDKRAEPYFMEDTIHLGWRGWLTLDQNLQAFLKEQATPTYQLNNQEFLSEAWQTKADF